MNYSQKALCGSTVLYKTCTVQLLTIEVVQHCRKNLSLIMSKTNWRPVIIPTPLLAINENLYSCIKTDVAS